MKGIEKHWWVCALSLVVVLGLTVIAAQSAQAQTFTMLHSFTSTPDGASPTAPVIDVAGNFYGTTTEGGTFNRGTIFKVNTKGKEVVLRNFTGGPKGGQPGAGLVLDSAGNFYGSTSAGGTSNSGTVFKLDTTGQEIVLYSFCSVALCVDGAFPLAGVVVDSAGNLYGTTNEGGTYEGTVFKVDTAGTETVLHNFTAGTDGAFPVAGVVVDLAGNLYGTTAVGGTSNYGTVFKVDTSGTETVLYSFAGGADGAYPVGGLVQDEKGNLYGTTYAGGAAGGGTVFKLNTKGTETVLHSFTGGTDGDGPNGLLARDAKGNLYGTTQFGGSFGVGTAFEVTAGGKETVLHTFTGGSDGGQPHGGLVMDTKGNLYGTTEDYGSGGYGTVFKLTP
jgi:uncharacterized repeat protein (TIGR03803 family)